MSSFVNHATGLSAFLLSFLLVMAQLCHAFQIRPATDAPKPLSPEESLKRFRVEHGFRVELVAAEPHVTDPVAVTWDAEGTLYACELHGYNLDGYLDIQELNKTGKFDKTVRRIQAPKWAQEKAAKLSFGRVKKLIDTNGNGRIDRSTVFADQLPPCYGIVPARGGIVVLCSPQIYFLKDSDGDGKAEIRQLLFTGFNRGELWSRANHLVWGLDQWIYACPGRGEGVTVTGPNLKSPVHLGGSAFRFKPDGSVIEPATGNAGGFGLGMSDWGDRFLIHNSTNGMQVTPIPYRYLMRNPYTPSPGTTHRAATYYNVFPISRPHPWRVARFRQKAWRDFYGTGEATPNGGFTAACSPTFYRGEAFPELYRGNLFACESQQNLVNRSVPVRKGSRLYLERPRNFRNREFLASTDGWFRPVNLATGPDGAFYVVDMCREIIEDYSAIPRYLQQQYGLIKGKNRGRIWRVVYENFQPRKRMSLNAATTDKLVKAVNHPNARWRTTAQRLLVEHQDKNAITGLTKIVFKSDRPQGVIHAMNTLEGLNSLKPDVLLQGLNHRHFAVRRNALRLAERYLKSDGKLLGKVASMTDDPSAPVRLQLALTLGESQSPQAIEALASLARGHLNDDWMISAMMSSLNKSAAKLVTRLLNAKETANQAAFLTRLTRMIGSRRETTEIENLLDDFSSFTAKINLRKVCLEGLLKGLQGAKQPPNLSPKSKAALVKLLDDDSSPVVLAAYRLANYFGLNELPEVRRMYFAARKRALDSELSIIDRTASIEILAGSDFEQIEAMAKQLLDARQPLEVQLATVKLISQGNDRRAANLLLSRWKSYSPRLQTDVLSAIFSRQNRIGTLLDAIEKKSILSQSLESIHRLQLLENPDPAISDRAKKLLATTTTISARHKIITQYRQALENQPQLNNGRTMFKQHCSTCHKVRNVGTDVGPLLSSVLNRPNESLIADILDPSSKITTGFRTYTAITEDGKIYTGILSSESATSITLRKEKGVDQVILRKNLQRIAASSKSLMPEGLEKNITPQQMVNLLGYLRQVYGSVKKDSTILFDDDPQFVNQLTSGKGVASNIEDDCFSGKISLSVTPPQRYSARISNWNFRIVEKPKKGQYRFLRLAWKVPRGKGAMIELAAAGHWPSSGSPIRRYYHGENTTKWQATQLSRIPPRNWTVITVDLWKDCGDFTLTGIAPTAMGGEVLFDRIELLRTLDDVTVGTR